MRAAFLTLVLWLVPWVALAAPPRTWDQARADEAEALRAERDALRKSLAGAKSSAAAAKASLRKDIDALSGELTRLQVGNASLETSLPGRERDRSRDAQAAALDDLMARLAARDHTALPEDADAQAALLPQLIARQLEAVAHEGSLRVQPHAEVFDVGGHATTTSVLHVGRVAALRWDGSGHPLIATAEGLRAVRGEFATPQIVGDAQVVTAVLYDEAAPPIRAASSPRAGAPRWTRAARSCGSCWSSAASRG